jgi:hypothetical protein
VTGVTKKGQAAKICRGYPDGESLNWMRKQCIYRMKKPLRARIELADD